MQWSGPKRLCRSGTDLLRRHRDVEHAQVGLQAVADQHAAGVHQVAQLQVRALERGQVPPRQRRVQVARNLPGLGFMVNPKSSQRHDRTKGFHMPATAGGSWRTRPDHVVR